MVKIRLHGLLEDLDPMVENLKNFYNVIEVSKPYKDRGDSQLHRIYVTVVTNK